MWDLIVSVPDHCLSFYFSLSTRFILLIGEESIHIALIILSRIII